MYTNQKRWGYLTNHHSHHSLSASFSLALCGCVLPHFQHSCNHMLGIVWKRTNSTQIWASKQEGEKLFHSEPALPMFSKPSCVPLKPQVHVREKLSQRSSTWTPKYLGNCELYMYMNQIEMRLLTQPPLQQQLPLEMLFSTLLWFCASSFSTFMQPRVGVRGGRGIN